MRSKALAIAFALVILAQACCCTTAIGGPEPPYTVIPSEEAAERFRDKVEQASQAGGQTISLTITEEEATSVFAQLFSQTQAVAPITPPQILFQDGRMEVYTDLKALRIVSIPGMVALSISASDGEFEVGVEEVAFGPIPVPEFALDFLTELVNQWLFDNILSQIGNIPIREVQIGDGEMTIEARRLSQP